MKKTLYLNIEDDVKKVAAKIKAQPADEIILVIPKQSYLFSDSINLRLLKKQTSLYNKHVSILTMDPEGQVFAEEAGFGLEQLPTIKKSRGLGDIRTSPAMRASAPAAPAARPKRVVKKRVVRRPVSNARPSVAAPSISSAKILKSRPRVQQTQTTFVPVEEPSDNVYMPVSNRAVQAPVKHSYKKWVVSFVVLSLILAVVLGLVVLPTATVKVYASSQVVARDLDIQVDASATGFDPARLIIPAIKVDETRTKSGTYTVNGKKEVGSKAEGRVALINLTGQPLTLRAGTTVLTVGNKTYLFKEDQNNINPVASANNDTNATVADIIAQEGGEDYNLPAGTRVEIANQAFGTQPQRLFARTVTQVVGGSSRFISVISQDDISASQQDLTKQTVDEINSEMGGAQKLVTGAYSVNIEEYESSAQLEEEATNFNAKGNVAIRGLAFDEQSLRELIRQRLIQTVGQDKVLQDKEFDTVVYKIKNLDVDQGIMDLSIHYESKANPIIDKRALLPDLTGKSQSEASDLILTNPDVERVEMTLSPFWQRSLPRFSSKINIEIVGE